MSLSSDKRVGLSVIIPLCNEEKVLPLLLKRIKESASVWGGYEVIFIDDGSYDGTMGILRAVAKDEPNYKVISFSRNFGHQSAITAGLEHARGDCVVLMDGDLQDPPDLIREMQQRQKEGFDIVYAVRKTRQEGFVKGFLYKFYYRLFRYLAYVDVPLDAGDFCLMSRRVVDVINALPERNRFVRGLRVWTGFSKTPILFDRGERAAGKTKFPLSRLIRFGFSGIMALSTRPLTVSIYIGTFIALSSFVVGIILVILRLTIAFNVSGWTSLILVVFFMGGVQLLILGVLGQYIGLIYMEAQHRPVYIVKEKIRL